MSTPTIPLDQVLVGDCIQALAGLPEAFADLIFADPPYNLQLRGELWRPNMTKVDAVDDAWDRFASFEDYDNFTRAWLQACRRALKPNGTLWAIGTYHNVYRIGAILQDLGFWILNDIVWVKRNPMPNFRGVRFTNAHETLIWAQKQQRAAYTFNYRAMKELNGGLQMRSEWNLPVCQGKERIRVRGTKAHPTQKPEALLERVIVSSSNPGDVVLDPFFGTGTTGAVAKRFGRRWIGIEREPHYARLAERRIAAVELGQAEGVAAQVVRPERVAFKTLLDRGLLQAGQTLSFGQLGSRTATVLADGQIRCGAAAGSIHAVGRALQGAPCNGWQHWYYRDATTGERYPIDRLRQQLRDEEAQDESGSISPSASA